MNPSPPNLRDRDLDGPDEPNKLISQEDPREYPPGMGTTWAEFEGYLSLTLTVVVLSVDFWGRLVEAIFPYWLGIAIGPCALVFACVFGISGARTNRGGSRVAAIISLSLILTLIALAVYSRLIRRDN